MCPESKQPQCDTAHQRHRRTQAFRRCALEPCRADTACERLRKRGNQPSRCLRQRPRHGLRTACDCCITQPSPFPPFVRVRLWVPDVHGGTREARLVAHAIARAPRGTALTRGGAEEEGGSPRWLMRPRPPRQDHCVAGASPASHLQDASGTLAGLGRAYGPIVGRTHDEPLAERVATAPMCLDVRLTIPDPEPAYPFRGGAHPLAGGLPWRRFPLPVLSRLGGFSRCAWSTRLPYIILLVAQPEDFHGGASAAWGGAAGGGGHRAPSTACPKNPCQPAAPCPIGPSPGTGFLPEKGSAVVSARRQATPGVCIALRTSSRWPAGPLSGVASGGLHS